MAMDLMQELALVRKLALMTDDQVIDILDHIVKGEIKLAEFPKEVWKDEEGVNGVLAELGAPSAQPIDQIDQNKAARAMLVAMIDDPELCQRLSKIIDGPKVTRVDPLTATLVLAGIVLVLSTKVEFEYVNENGKKKLRIKLTKSPTPTEILKKFFAILGR